MSKLINALDGKAKWIDRPAWVNQVYASLGLGRHRDLPIPITLDDQFKPWCKLTTVHQEAIKDAREDGYEILMWREYVAEFRGCLCPNWEPGCIYAVGELREEFREAEEEPEGEAKFKLFEIDYFNEYGPRRAGCASLNVGCVLGIDREWQIFGYTDDDDWIARNEKSLSSFSDPSHEHYETEPCDHISNRKYAIGRKVK